MQTENNIKYDAYYLISKSTEGITNLKLQKLMYFFEAYYMNIHTDCKSLYECNFSAWNFGPVAIPLYKEFRKFGNGNITLTPDEINKGNSISEEKKELLNNIYNSFKNYSAIDLVRITHMVGSPWDEVWQKNGKKVGYGADTYIDKIQSRDWFKEKFLKSE